MPEAAVLFESLTGQEFLELSGRLHGVEEDRLQMRIGEIPEIFGLSSDRTSRLDTYSKGMRQKALIGAALLHNPELILPDEPLSGLDVNAAIMIKDLIAALASDEKTILYSSHVLDVVERVCDRVVIIHRGSLIADGSLESLKASTNLFPLRPLEIAFMIATPPRCLAKAVPVMRPVAVRPLRLTAESSLP